MPRLSLKMTLFGSNYCIFTLSSDIYLVKIFSNFTKQNIQLWHLAYVRLLNKLAKLQFSMVETRVVKNLKIFDLILTSKFEVFRGLSSKNLDISNLNYPQNLILNHKYAVLILTSNFEVFFEDPQKTSTFGGHSKTK